MKKIIGCNLPYGIMRLQFKRDGRLREKITVDDECNILGTFEAAHIGFAKGFDIFEYKAMTSSLMNFLDLLYKQGFGDCLISFKRTKKMQ